MQKKIAIGPDETADQLEPRMAELGVTAVAEAMDQLEIWDGQSDLGAIQDASRASRAPRLTKQQGHLDWSRGAAELFNQIRAFQPWPGSFSCWMPGGGEPLRLIVHQAVVINQAAHVRPGTVQRVTDSGICVATGDGLLELRQVQPAGKRSMSAAEFLRGRPVREGDRFGNGKQTGPATNNRNPINRGDRESHE